MDSLRVRVYNVRFGDAILISLPDAPPGASPELRHILIDVGNSLGTEGGQDTVFATVLHDVLHELDGRPLDLYVMTHEHLDHVQGLLHFQKKVLKEEKLKDLLQVQHSWLTPSAHPNYYTPDTAEYNPRARERKHLVEAFLDEAERYFRAAPDEETSWIRGLMAINNPRATADCVDLIRDLAGDNTHYVHRGLDLAGKHGFREATFEVWAPEVDTSVYYGPFQPVAFGVSPSPTPRARPALTPVEPPRGVDAGAFYNLVEKRRWGLGDNLLAIDSAQNNTSVVFSLNWRGWSLLFPGDAEERSWKEMNKRGVLKPVHFLKVSHHGSVTGMLPEDLIDKVLTLDGTPRHAVLSAYPDLVKVDGGEQSWTYQDVPRREVLEGLKERAVLRQTVEVADGGTIDYYFEGGSSNVTVTIHE